MRKIIGIAFVMVLLGSLPAASKVVHLLPKPQQIVYDSLKSSFCLQRAVRIEDPTSTSALLRFLEETECPITTNREAPCILVELVSSITDTYDYQLEGYPNEAYRMVVNSDKICIQAITHIGVIRAAQTLAQLAEGYVDTPYIEAVTITDFPAFKLRGLMHDVGRSFISVDEIKKELDLLSRFKVNTFHFHLTENQAWRFQVKQFPELTADTSMTRFAGCYYTQEECLEIEAFAAERGIVVIPEIDMPGHSEAFIRAMGYQMQTDKGIENLLQILEEVTVVFSRSPYIHIGADEVSITYPNFLRIIIDKIHELGKRVVCWNPIAGVNISENIGIDMTQMWSNAGQKIKGIPNIDCRYNYINHFDVYADVVGIYNSNIYYEKRGSTEIAGTITAIWNDRKLPAQEDIVRQNNLYANVLASAERAWIGGGEKYIESAGTMLPIDGKVLEEFVDWERRFLFHKANSLKNEPIPYVKQTNILWNITDAFPNKGNKEAIFPPEKKIKKYYNYNGTLYHTKKVLGGGIYLQHVWDKIIPSHYTNPQSNQTAYAWTWVYSPMKQVVGAQIEFQNYGRSEKDRAPNYGVWDYKGSRVWINNVEIKPPIWQNTTQNITNEVDLRNENFTARPTTKVNLKKGWNKIFLKLPYIDLPRDIIRLNKWMFTFVLTDVEGRNAVEGLVYSPDKTFSTTKK